MAACDELYWTSELGSEDEKFAASCGGTVAEPVGGLCAEDMSAILADPTLLRMVLAGMFEEMSTEEVEEACSSYDTLGARGVAEAMAEELPGADIVALEAFLDDVFEEMC